MKIFVLDRLILLVSLAIFDVELQVIFDTLYPSEACSVSTLESIY